MTLEHLERESSAPLAAELTDLQEGLAALNSVVGAVAKFVVEESEANAEIHRAFRSGFKAVGRLNDFVEELAKRVHLLEVELGLSYPKPTGASWWRRLFG